jgi:thiamine biosynthesis lipoprotein
MKANSYRTTRILFIALVFMLGACACQDSGRLHKTSRLLMGTLVEITVVGESHRASQAAAAVAHEMTRIENLTSFHKTSSALSRINSNAGGERIRSDPELLVLIQKSLHFAAISGGTFDPTIGPVSLLWNFSAGEPRLPESREISEALAKVGWRRVELDIAAGTVALPEKGMALDLGAIAKGYALDRAGVVLRQFGITSALINAGGDIIALGEKGPKKPWRVGVQDPNKPNSIVAVALIQDRAIVTSGDYERFFMRNGKRYHHILDPRNGYPAQGLRSVTIVAQDGVTADAMSTAVFVLGPEDGMSKIESTEGVEGLLIDDLGNIKLSRGARALFELRH